LNSVYPEIAVMGFPMGMAKAELALLNFIMGSGFFNMAVALCGVALATVVMSCADTFATSGASCIARDVYRRHTHPDAIHIAIFIASASYFFVLMGGTTGNLCLLGNFTKYG
jgi:SSS family solute:Na+ symporter